MVWHHTVAPGDVVVVDRNCHKSILHAIIMTGSIPVFLPPTRNHYGIIGPIGAGASSPPSRSAPRSPPIRCSQGVDAAKVKPRILTLTQSTYDGVLYNTETIKHALDGYIDTMHFDEAWLPHAAFHDFYGQFHAMGRKRPRPKNQIVFATQSTHKLLAGISQASQVLVQDAKTRKLDPHLFNEAYLMHSSTSPQYAIIASCDVSAAMMEAPGGKALVEESISESLDFRRAMRKVDGEYGKDWWFKVWGPEKLAASGIGTSADWMLKANAKWHGFGDLAEGFNLLDPIKCTLITPGLDMSGKFARTGIPAAIVTKYLVDHGVVVEKTGLYSFFIMFTIGITKGRWNTLLTALQQFKDDCDRNQPCWKVMPEFTAAHPRYERVGLRDLSQSIHEFYARDDIARLVTDMYTSAIVPAMKPSDAFACIAHGKTERVDIDQLEGRISTTLLTPYPPGIPLLIPGEMFNRKIVDYLRFTRAFNKAFPGFDTDVHGLMSMSELQGVGVEDGQYFVDCVR